jgi:hypothetical protein
MIRAILPIQEGRLSTVAKGQTEKSDRPPSRSVLSSHSRLNADIGGMSEMCQQETHAPPQLHSLSRRRDAPMSTDSQYAVSAHRQGKLVGQRTGAVDDISGV